VNTPHELRIAIPHLDLAAQTWGDETLPPLLALHGWLDNAGSFALLAPRLAAHYRVIALDLPGHGHSSHLPPGSNYHHLDYVGVVLATLDALQIECCTLLGHSLGAGVASLAAAAQPQRFERLLLIEGLGPLGDDGTQTLKRFRDAMAPRASKPLRRFRDIEQALQARSLVGGLEPELSRPIIERGLVESADGWHWRSDPRLTRPSAVRLAESQVQSLLRGITAPTRLLLADPAAPYLPPGQMQARAACVPRIDVTRMAGGHHLHLEFPQVVSDWINHT